MRITIIAVGTRGDVQPHVALAKGLRNAGHSVRVATHAGYASLVRAHGLSFAPVAGDPRSLLAGRRQVMAEARGTALRDLRFLRTLLREQEALAYEALADCLAASQGADALICSTVAIVGPIVAEKLAIPAFSSALQPLSRTTAFPLFMFPELPRLGPRYNRLTYTLAQRVVRRLTRPLVSRCRQRLGLSPMVPPRPVNGPQPPVLYGFSPLVVPRPADWGEQVYVTGYWFLDRLDDWRPPDALQRFLDAGSPPVYVGFGSSRTRDPEATVSLVLEALKATGQRGILETGWGGLGRGSLPPDVFQVDETPHDWLFPRMATVVHHSGAGTVAASLRAGVPTVTVPFDGDKPFWARRVHALGVGPPPIPWKQLTAARLSAAIGVAVGDVAVQRRAAGLGEQLRAENGVGRAVEIVHRHLFHASERIVPA